MLGLHPELSALSDELLDSWPPLTPGFHHLLLDGGQVTLTLLFGDVRETLPALDARVDAIYLDGFAPQKNPQMWSDEVFAAVSALAAPDATLASWCVAGEVRTALSTLDWNVRKTTGFGKKRHMLQGQRGGVRPADSSSQHAIVIGAGIAGCSTVEALARRGWRVTLIERKTIAAEASGNPLGLLHPMLALDDNLAARFSRAAYLYALRKINRLLSADRSFPAQASGVLQIAGDVEEEAQQRKLLARLGFPDDYVQWLDQTAASGVAGMQVRAGGWFFPHAAWISPADFCAALLREAGERLDPRLNENAASISFRDDEWQVLDEHGACMASAPVVVLANAHAAGALCPDIELGLHVIRGQISYLPETALAGLKTGLCGAGYAINAPGKPGVIGASFVEHDRDERLRADEHAENLARLDALLRHELQPGPQLMGGRVSFRTVSGDRMPLVGRLPAPGVKASQRLSTLPRQKGLFCLLGLGARGLSWAPLAGELLASVICDDALPLEKALVGMLDPARFQLRHVRKM